MGAARRGANVVLLAKTAEPHPRLPGTVHTAAAEIEEAGGKALAVVGDVRKEEDVARAVDAAVDRFGGVDICVNNASAISVDPTEELSAKKFDLMQQINIRGTFLLTRACLPHLRKSPNAHVLTISPPMNMNPYWLGVHPSYTLSKYGMTLLSLGWAVASTPRPVSHSTVCGRRRTSRPPRWRTRPRATRCWRRRAVRRSWQTPPSRSCPARPPMPPGSATSTARS